MSEGTAEGESEVEDKTVPSTEKYGRSVATYNNAYQKVREYKRLGYDRLVDLRFKEEFDEAEAALEKARSNIKELRETIVAGTNAIDYYGDLVLLENGRSRKGNDAIIIKELYRGPYLGMGLPILTEELRDPDCPVEPGPEEGFNKILPRAAFAPDLSNAPANFKRAIDDGSIFLKGLDGAYDVAQRYDQIPYTEEPEITTSSVVDE